MQPLTVTAEQLPLFRSMFPGGITYVPPGIDPASYLPCLCDETPSRIVGDYFLKKYRDRAAAAGVPTVALQLKKQGVPVEVAALILAVRS